MAGWYTTEGAILSLGAEWIAEEHPYNFSLFSEHAERVTLLLFGEDDPAQPLLEHRLDPRVNKTWYVWHCRLGEEMVFGARYYLIARAAAGFIPRSQETLAANS